MPRVLAPAALLLIFALHAHACSKRDLRGRSVPSPDRKTYLVIDDANSSACKWVLVDGKTWPHAVGTPGLVAPGRHRISCGGDIEFEVREATTFHFDYWGP